MNATFNDPDGADVIALARAIGLSCIKPAPGVDDDARSGSANVPELPGASAETDGADIIALARAIGLSGIRAAPGDHDETSRPVGTTARETSGTGAEIDETITLARAVGISGVRPAETDAERAAVEHVYNPKQSAPQIPLPKAAPSASAYQEAIAAQSKPSVSSVAAPAGSAEPTSPFYVRLQMIGTQGEHEARAWQAANGRLVAPTEHGEISLEKGPVSNIREVVFKAPSDKQSRDALRRAAGKITSNCFRLQCDRSLNAHLLRFQGPAVAHLPAKFLASREPPALPAHLLAALTKADRP